MPPASPAPSPTSRRLPLRAPAERLAARLGLDLVELACLVALAGVSVAILGPLLTRGRPLSGADGMFPADQLQYLAWIRDAAHHGLIGNRFDLAPGERPFLHPGFLTSGVLYRLGVGLELSLLLWKPVALAVTFVGARAYVRRLLERTGERHAALVLALFAVMPAVAVVAWTGWGGRPRQYTFDFISGEMWTGQYLWGYLMTAIAVFLLPLTLLAVERWRRGDGGARTLAWAAAGALTVSWLQPWQGATLLLIVGAVEAFAWWRSRSRPDLRLAVVLAAGVLPLAYYAVVAATDPAWQLAGEANARGAQPEWQWPWWAIVLTLLPLAAPAALAYRLPAPTWQERAVRVWPFAALVVFLLPVGTFPYHAFQGLALPLGILAVQGVASVRWRPSRALVLAALFVMTVPGFAHKLSVAAENVHLGADPYFVFPDEVRALRALEEDPRAGGVLAPLYSGFLVPARTGRETYVGALSWSPDWRERRRLADALFEGRLRGAPARAFVGSTRARFLYADCRDLRDLAADLRPLLAGVRRFGCATVYELRVRPEMLRAAGPPDG